MVRMLLGCLDAHVVTTGSTLCFHIVQYDVSMTLAAITSTLSTESTVQSQRRPQERKGSILARQTSDRRPVATSDDFSTHASVPTYLDLNVDPSAPFGTCGVVIEYVCVYGNGQTSLAIDCYVVWMMQETRHCRQRSWV